MTESKHVIQLAAVPVEQVKAPKNSPFGGERQRVGLHIGAQKLGYSFFTVPPGKAAFPYHAHIGNEEMIYIIEGEGVLRLGENQIAVTAETVIACPPGGAFAHQLVNTGARDLRYLVVSTMAYPDFSEYPDSSKVGVFATPAAGPQVGDRAFYLKEQRVDYFDGDGGEAVERIVKAAHRSA